jgi:hypothetical protein
MGATSISTHRVGHWVGHHKGREGHVGRHGLPIRASTQDHVLGLCAVVNVCVGVCVCVYLCF